jgi:pre-mRNA cleavage complex 2 protein Pcf11
MDIDDLTTDAKIDCATHPMDQAAQNKLTTLQTLKEILDSGNASPSDIIDIRNSIAQQMAKRLVEKQHAPAVPHVSAMPTRPPFIQSPQLAHAPTPQFPQVTPQQPVQMPSSLLNSTNLAELLRATTSQNTTPQPPSYPAPYMAPAANGATPQANNGGLAPAGGELALLAQLRASGIISANPTPPQGLTPPTAFAIPGAIEVSFTSASIKIGRPQLVTSFLTARPNQCSTCGRRFTSDEIGREKKARHLDWHFKTKARMIEAERRGQNRSWYVDGREWIASREVDDDAPEDAATGVSPSAAKKKQPDYVRAPSDPVLRSMPCPIDQEPFKSEWSEEVQDFIWKDAVLVGGRYYHASCYREVTKDRDKDTGGLTPMGAGVRTATPDSVLGKRKAEQEANGTKSKLKVEG